MIDKCGEKAYHISVWSKTLYPGIVFFNTRGLTTSYRCIKSAVFAHLLFPDVFDQTPPAGDENGIFDYGRFMAEITLVGGKVAIIDEEDIEKTKEYKWYSHYNHNNYYAIGFKYVDGKQIHSLLHRLILGASPNETVDHIDFDGLNNQKNNLRIVSASENARHHRKSKSNTSGYKGVNWDSQYKKWRAQLRVDGKARSIGRFDDKKSAALAYDNAARRYFGEFAVLNFPEYLELDGKVWDQFPEDL